MKPDPEEPKGLWCDRRRSFAVRAGFWVGAALLLAAPGRAQPHAEGAVRTLEDKPKGSAPPLFATVCAVSADGLLTGHDCAELLDCTTPGVCDFAGGLDHVAAGTGLRNRRSGTVGLAGAPPGAVAVGAWLYWGLIADDAEGGQNDLAAIVLDGHELTGELIDVAPAPCWGSAPGEAPLAFRAYRKSVLDLLHAGINGDYEVEVPSSSVGDGRDPWRGAPAPPPWVDGVSLVVLYAHPDVPRGARFYLHEGAALLVGDLVLRNPLPALDPVPPVASELRHTRLGGGGQRHAGYEPTYPFTSWISWDPPSCSLTPSLQIAGPGSEIDPVSDWKGGDGGPTSQLWDTQVAELPWTEDVSGCEAYEVSYDTAEIPGEGSDTEAGAGFFYDCVVVVAHALTVR